MSYQKLIVIGYLGRDPDTKTLPSGDVVTNISVATTEKWTAKDGAKAERTTWFAVSFWGRLAEIAAEYLRKGSLVYVEGTVSTRTYVTRSGETAASLELRARELKMLSSGKRDDEGGAPEQTGATASVTREPIREQPVSAAPEEFDDDIPF